MLNNVISETDFRVFIIVWSQDGYQLDACTFHSFYKAMISWYSCAIVKWKHWKSVSKLKTHIKTTIHVYVWSVQAVALRLQLIVLWNVMSMCYCFVANHLTQRVHLVCTVVSQTHRLQHFMSKAVVYVFTVLLQRNKWQRTARHYTVKVILLWDT